MTISFTRHRRLRNQQAIRNLVREHQLNIHDLIQPLFVIHGHHQKKEVPSMPGVFQLSIDQLVGEIDLIVNRGIQAVLLFGIPESKDEEGSAAYASEGIVQQAVRFIKQLAPDLIVITDVCLCQYTLSGHCGIVQVHEMSEQQIIANDVSLSKLIQIALSHVHAGADIVAPSNMMDGCVAAIRHALDGAGFQDVAILAYAVKYASAFYGPFRDAADSKPQFSNRHTYQMDPANAREAIREAKSDIAEGADFIMVKPALAYMDILYRIREMTQTPIVAYHVSGEYAMIKAASQRGWIDEQAVVMETMLGFKRAGSDMIITYYAKELAEWIKHKVSS